MYPVYGYSEQYDARGFLPEEQNVDPHFYENANYQVPRALIFTSIQI